MNKSPWKDIDDAFNNMFDETVVVKCKRDNEEFSQTLNVYISVNMTDETILDDALETDREEISLLVVKSDWAYLDKIQRGDLIVRYLQTERKYRVVSIDYDAVMGYSIIAREI